MQVILLERVAKLGQMGEVVDVKPGFARNYLLPQGKALSASQQNIADFEARKSQLEAQNLETRTEAESMAAKLSGQQFIVIRQASDSGSLYGSVSTRDAAEAATENGFTLDRKQVSLTRPIKELGLHDVIVSLHPEVEATIQLNVARSPEEAELQASGKSIQDAAAEADEAADFEIAELFEDIGAAASEDEDLADMVEGDSGADNRENGNDDDEN
ncbi:50S ribosomal protein L9 [Roseovarius litorisediminis]|uniref:Large ribosomal subunit protein bL9 n=1 Tax=Roseovarius litorisediminis TaxID=1312363 RepID=A0A1Y5THB2_9RHOB|nr:50S ribosomal protein L9 [Roseovarius litorisediminis]SLN64253.1 50S ribosomal protein L9 [Roseovarius litorisediminis]